jgi:hypothetical protein
MDLMSPAAASLIISSGERSPGGQVGQDVDARVVALAAGGRQTEEHRSAGRGDPIGDQDRLGASARVVAETAAVQIQVVQLDIGQAAG